jgi:dipeptidyl aminopeptidase/acylaminoacyl peptidase
MALASGTRLGTYEIRGLIGAGGMGEVYQAHDTKLDRNVAIKVLPQQFAGDSERLARFQREAKMLAALNHPNIAAIYGLEQSGDIHYLVMELVAGQTLAERIRTGPVPLDEALRIAEQIAEALEAAHGSEKGIIHRDLKPANVKVTPEGRVKVLDFGLAKAFATEQIADDIADSPTLSALPTMQGTIMGTAAYMSPEQARGKTVTKASDIWAFGCVLFELLTGKQAFHGRGLTDVLAVLLTQEPNWAQLPKGTPPTIRTLLQRCLRKDPRQRLQDAAGVRIEIEDVLSGAAAAEPVAVQHGSSRRLAWSVAAVATILAVMAGIWGTLGKFRAAPVDVRAMRFFVSPPGGWTLMTTGLTTTAPVTVSPDGQHLALVARGADGKTMLWVRALDGLTPQLLAGTDGALRPFWSPDSRFLGFFAGGKLKKIEVAGGPPINLCDVADGFGGTWSRNGVIVFALGAASTLQKVPASGGPSVEATTLGQGEIGHRMPFFLPDGQHFLYRARTTGGGAAGPIYIASLDSAERKLLFNADSANVIYAQGHLIFLRETTLMAQPFDAERLELTGDAVPIAERIQTQGAPVAGVYSASENGVLAYVTGTGTTGSQLLWFDRAGKQLGMLGDTADYTDLELSPDGKRASVSIPDQAGQGRDIWIYDVARGLKTRFTFDPAEELGSIWSPDGSRLVFNSRRKGHLDLYQKDSSGAGSEQLLLQDNEDKTPTAWSPDGRFIVYSNNGDVFALPLSGDHKPIPVVQTQFSETNGQFSPDGRWVVYASSESGRYEIYAAPFPGPRGKWQISTGGGIFPRWRRNGTEIYYLALDNKLMAAAVNEKGPSLEVGAVKPLFDTRAIGVRYAYDVTADGQRFLINSFPTQSASAPITVVVNWTAGLKK